MCWHDNCNYYQSINIYIGLVYTLTSSPLCVLTYWAEWFVTNALEQFKYSYRRPHTSFIVEKWYIYLWKYEWEGKSMLHVVWNYHTESDGFLLLMLIFFKDRKKGIDVLTKGWFILAIYSLLLLHLAGFISTKRLTIQFPIQTFLWYIVGARYASLYYYHATIGLDFSNNNDMFWHQSLAKRHEENNYLKNL